MALLTTLEEQEFTGIVNAATVVEKPKTLRPKLSDLIREGSQNTVQSLGWGNGSDRVCALGAAYIAAQRRGYELP